MNTILEMFSIFSLSRESSIKLSNYGILKNYHIIITKLTDRNQVFAWTSFLFDEIHKKFANGVVAKAMV